MQRYEPASRTQWLRNALSRFEGPLTRYAARLLGDIDRARDVVQDVFLRLWETDRGEVDDHLAQWLFTVCRNKALDVQRKERRMTSLTDEQMRVRDSNTSSACAADSPAESSCVLVAVHALPDRQQELIRLKFQNGLSYKEIAGVMDLTVTNVGVLLHKAIKALRGRLAVNPDAGAGTPAPGTTPGTTTAQS